LAFAFGSLLTLHCGSNGDRENPVPPKVVTANGGDHSGSDGGKGGGKGDPCPTAHSVVATWDMPAGTGSSLCKPGRDDCLVCSQGVDSSGHVVTEYVVSNVPSTCGCPVAPELVEADAGTR